MKIPMINERLTNKIVISELNRDDSMIIDLTGVTDKENQYFYLEQDSKESRTNKHNTRLEYEIFLDRDVIFI